MTPHAFLAKWRNSELKERSASQSHFNDLCALLGVLDPVAADPAGEWFTFEKGATKIGGGEGWADVWRRGCFAWEYKGRHANLDKAFAQLLQYSVALENPPLLITSDMDRIRLHTNWTNSVQEVREWVLEDLLDGAKRDELKRAFTDPDHFKPSKTRAALTEETAREFAGLAQRLRDRGHEAQAVAHFVNRLVFCMFAEDVGLLPDNLFTKMLEVSRRNAEGFVDIARTLFGALARQVADRPVDPGRLVRARAGSGQAQPAGRALYRSGQDRADRAAGHRRAACRRTLAGGIPCLSRQFSITHATLLHAYWRG